MPQTLQRTAWFLSSKTKKVFCTWKSCHSIEAGSCERVGKTLTAYLAPDELVARNFILETLSSFIICSHGPFKDPGVKKQCRD